jgi:hypothetical protein
VGKIMENGTKWQKRAKMAKTGTKWQNRARKWQNGDEIVRKGTVPVLVRCTGIGIPGSSYCSILGRTVDLHSRPLVVTVLQVKVGTYNRKERFLNALRWWYSNNLTSCRIAPVWFLSNLQKYCRYFFSRKVVSNF